MEELFIYIVLIIVFFVFGIPAIYRQLGDSVGPGAAVIGLCIFAVLLANVLGIG